jgi:CIC family chloride channel protein
MKAPITVADRRRWMVRLLKWRIRLQQPTSLEFFDSPLLWAGLVGFLGALSSVLFREALAALGRFVSQSTLPLEQAVETMSSLQRLLIPTIGALCAGAVLSLGKRLVTSASHADFMEAVTLGDGKISVSNTLVRTISSLVTNGTGGSIGREGPMVQSAAMLASLVGEMANLSPARRRLLVACGAAAGIACAYNAPITGALFVAEILMGSIAMESFGPLVFSSAIATTTARQFLGAEPVYKMPPNLFATVPNWQLADYAMLGVLAGCLAPVFLNLLRQSESLFKILNLPLVVRFGLGGLILGLISLYEPRVWGNGYVVVESILNSPLTFWVLLDILLFKLLATAATTGSGAVGGVFTPTLFCGAVLGALFAKIQAHLLPWGFDPASFAVVGMGCFLSATTRAPVMSIIIIFEMTLSYGAIMPLMLACTTSFYVARQWGGESMYSAHLRGAKPKGTPLFLMIVGDLMKKNPLTIPSNYTFSKIISTFAAHTFKHLYVVDKEGKLVGAIALQDLKPFLQDTDVPAVVLALDLVQDIPMLSVNDSLQESLAVFSQHDGERLPVVDSRSSRVLVGSLSKTDVLLTLAHGLDNKV